jgi:hypothetical protein
VWSVLEISEDAHLFSAVEEFYTLFLCCKICQISSDVWLHSADVREQAQWKRGGGKCPLTYLCPIHYLIHLPHYTFMPKD